MRFSSDELRIEIEVARSERERRIDFLMKCGILLGWIGGLVIVAVSLLLGCTAFYQECTTAGRYRCNGDTVEICTGTQWSPRTPCDKLTVDGVPAPERCVADGDGARCEDDDGDES
jgi:hypothetical protein